eukprot:TRINITY_DN4163_c0_g1_i2.p1 TRINITY_DN4163_c0_g1~~TRINITY_DN4163_c0_g1_i2.p1  ORF type:complete len:320 (+),score=90.10 TRINITY_DN4163_c0_g1_i2:102-1061(+)
MSGVNIMANSDVKMDVLQVNFTAFNTVHGVKKPYTVYEMEARAFQTVTWIVYKRYNDFHTLHADVSKVVPKLVQLPKLPPKRVTGILMSDFVEKRKQELQSYMSDLLKIPQVITSDEIRKFLEVPDSVPSFGKAVKDISLPESKTPEAKIQDLILTLSSSSTNKVAALKSFEKYYFESKPKLSNDVINALFQGADNQGGLVEAVGNFESKVAARAALELLRRLIDLERNKDAQMFVDALTRIDAKSFGKLKLFQHIKNDHSNTAAFEIAAIITEKLPQIGIERLIPEPEALLYFRRWKERKQLITRPYIQGLSTRLSFN